MSAPIQRGNITDPGSSLAVDITGDAYNAQAQSPELSELDFDMSDILGKLPDDQRERVREALLLIESESDDVEAARQGLELIADSKLPTATRDHLKSYIVTSPAVSQTAKILARRRLG